MSFSDYRTALVTGASSGIGAAVVERLRREGLEVHALARSADALEALAARTGCIPHAIDVTDRAALASLAGEIDFDILVNNAGVDRPKKFLEAEEGDIDLLIDVNLRAVLHLCRLVVPGLMNKVFAVALRLLPHTLLAPLLGWLFHPRAERPWAHSDDEKN